MRYMYNRILIICLNVVKWNTRSQLIFILKPWLLQSHHSLKRARSCSRSMIVINRYVLGFYCIWCGQCCQNIGEMCI